VADITAGRGANLALPPAASWASEATLAHAVSAGADDLTQLLIRRIFLPPAAS